MTAIHRLALPSLVIVLAGVMVTGCASHGRAYPVPELIPGDADRPERRGP